MDNTDDKPHFVVLVEARLRQFNLELANRLRIVPSLHNVTWLERLRYLTAQDLSWVVDTCKAALAKISRSSQKVNEMDLVEGFKHVMLAHLEAGMKLVEAGAASCFVYLPLGEGLTMIPLGGYPSFSVAAWLPVENMAAIRAAMCNADVVADKALDLLVIPKAVYLRHWYVPFSAEELKSLLVHHNDPSVGIYSCSRRSAKG